MPVLIGYLRQYGPREYLFMLTVAVLCGLGVAALINASSGGRDAGQALLKTRAQIEAGSSRVLTTRVYRPVRESQRSRRHAVRARRHARSRARYHSPARFAPVPQAPAAPQQPPAVDPQPTPAPIRVVRSPAPAPTPTEARRGGKGGGSIEFDDSG